MKNFMITGGGFLVVVVLSFFYPEKQLLEDGRRLRQDVFMRRLATVQEQFHDRNDRFSASFKELNFDSTAYDWVLKMQILEADSCIFTISVKADSFYSEIDQTRTITYR